MNNRGKIFALLVSIVVLLILRSFETAEPANLVKLNSGDIRFVFYNVENLFDIHDNPNTHDDDLTPSGKLHWTKKRYDTKLTHVDEVLSSLIDNIPAIIGLCEVENEAALKGLVERENFKNNNYTYLITSSKDPRGANVALMYCEDIFQVIHNTSYRPNIGADYAKYSRDILHVSGYLSNRDTIDVFVCHLPSRGGGVAKTRPYRIKATELLRAKTDSLLNLRQNPNIIIMGDFNDYPNDISVRKTLGAQSIDAEKKKTNLYNLFSGEIGKEKPGSYKYQGKWGFIDQFIVNGSLLMNSKTTYIQNSEADAYSSDYMLEEDRKYGGYKPFRTYAGLKYLGGYSDHLPIYFDLIVR